jgi:hypothetical protein
MPLSAQAVQAEGRQVRVEEQSRLLDHELEDIVEFRLGGDLEPELVQGLRLALPSGQFPVLSNEVALQSLDGAKDGSGEDQGAAGDGRREDQGPGFGGKAGMEQPVGKEVEQRRERDR